jgi:uncharacterized membrane protein
MEGPDGPYRIGCIDRTSYDLTFVMTELFLAVAVFLLTHSLPAARPLRARLVAAIGRGPYLVGYSILSLAVLTWVALAYARAPYVPVWDYRGWAAWVPLLTMPMACVLGVGALMVPNPLSVAVRRRGYDPARPGLLAITRHPLIWAFILWAGGHLIANEDLASTVLFGLLLALSLAGPFGVDAKARRALGEAEWQRLSAPTSNWPFSAVLRRRVRLRDAWPGWGPVLGGVLVYAALLHLHGPVIGVIPWAGVL